MAEKYRTHTLAVTFSKPVTEKAARAYLAEVGRAVAAFAVLSRAAWEREQNPVIERTAIRRRTP